MDLQLENRHALISGGSKGIGLACARGFLEEGARVSLVSRDPANLEAARRTLRIPPGAKVVGLFPSSDWEVGMAVSTTKPGSIAVDRYDMQNLDTLRNLRL